MGHMYANHSTPPSQWPWLYCLQEPDQSAQDAPARHYDDSSVTSYVCQQVSENRCVNLTHYVWLNMPTSSSTGVSQAAFRYTCGPVGLASTLMRHIDAAVADRQTLLTVGPLRALMRCLAV